MNFILGQEVVVAIHGVGRVMGIRAHSGLKIKTHADGVTRDYAAENVKPWPLIVCSRCHQSLGHLEGEQ